MADLQILKDLVIYQNENGSVKIEVLYDNENFWLTQKTMAELFNVKIKREIAESFALNEYNKYRIIQDFKYESDFDKLIGDIKLIDIDK